MPPDSIPAWVQIVAGVLVAALGWFSRSLAARLQARVDDRLNLSRSQQQFADGLAARVKDLEDRMERMAAEHRSEVEEIRRTYERQIQTIRDHYESRIAHLEQLVEGRHA